MVEIAHPLLHPLVGGMIHQMPVERPFLAPLPALGELLPHEQQLLAGIPPHQAIIGPQRGEFLPVIARHLVQQRRLAMHHLVMAQRQHEILGKGVEQAEGDVVMMMAAMHRIALQITQRVVHEPHIPFETETQATAMHRTRHVGPAGRFLRDRHHPAMGAVQDGVELLEEGHCLHILPPAMIVGHPLAGRPRIIEIEHGSDGIDAQPVDMIALGPEQRIIDQILRYLAPPEIIDGGIPVGVESLARIGMFIQRRAVKIGQPVFVGREMRRHPIQNNANPGLMRPVDKTRKARRIAEPRGRRIETQRLVPPTGIIGIFADRQKFDMGKAHADDIGDQPPRQFIPAQKIAGLVPLP